MKKIIILLFLLLAIVLVFRYFLFSTMEERIYVRRRPYTQDLNSVSIYQHWDTNNSYYTFGFPYKRWIYENPYTYSLSFSIKDDSVKEIVIQDLVILLPNQQKIYPFEQEISINYSGTIFDSEQVTEFRETRVIDITPLHNENYKSISIMFRDINIPFETVDSFEISMTLTVHEKDGFISTKEIISEFEKEVTIKNITSFTV